MLRIIKTNINLMNKVSLISLNLNEIFIEANEVSSLLCMTKYRCWLPRVASSDPSGPQDGGGSRNTSKLTQHDQRADCSDLGRLRQSLALCLEEKREFNFWSFSVDFEGPRVLPNVKSREVGLQGKCP